MTSQQAEEYTVLARKYRPQTFKDLIGQDALVQTLTHAIEQDRLAHAYVLTGIRGIGKTSTARIIAKALTCIGEDGNGNATPDPCGVCKNCVEITESRHVDVLEMDAASRTGVNDIREIIDNANYLPTMARFKIYIIDEVHMLSKSAFNALLKTLEEPPQHVKFIFATTEVRKIPVTILSRCQRFDLPRVDTALMKEHLHNIAKSENVEVEDEAINVIARAAEGSVRDALSLLDQAIAHSNESKKVEFASVTDMLGLLGKDNIIDLFNSIAAADIEKSVGQLQDLYHSGADPVTILQDLLEVSHLMTKLKAAPSLADEGSLSKDSFERVKEISEKLDIPFLTRCWQMLVKGLDEARLSPNTIMAVEMIIIRIAYASQLPPPGDLIKKIQNDPASVTTAPAPSAPAPTSAPEGVPIQKLADPQSFEELVKLFKDNNEPFLHNWLQYEVHLVKFEKGRLEMRLTEAAPKELPNRVMNLLSAWTGNRWIVIVSNEEGKETLNEKKVNEINDEKDKARNDQEVLKVLEKFPGSEIVSVNQIDEDEAEISDDSLPEVKSGEVT